MKRRHFLGLAVPLGVAAEGRIENESSRHWHARVAQFARESVPQGSLVFLGDSMTERFAPQALLGSATKRALVNRGIGGDKVGGWRYWGLLDRLDAVLALQPAQLVLMIGINDLVFAGTPVQRLWPACTQLLERLHAGVPRVLVQAVLPVRGSLPVHAPKLGPFNAHLQQQAERLGLDWLTLHDAFADPQGLLRSEWAADAVHLNEAGYRHWAAALAPRLL